MATINEGYNGEPTTIRVSKADNFNRAELWIEMYNAELWIEMYNVPGQGEIDDWRKHTLHHMTIEEAIELRDELNATIKDMAGL